jgi:hypothetical protein
MFTGVIAQPARAELSFDFAYSNLSPYGSWLISTQYGRVWQPAEYSRGWNPYYDGHWVDTDLGWTWVSDYSWGSIPYHYGTWVDDPVLGWAWIPGEVWAPSWVVFRTSPDYIGWAPVPPNFSVGVSLGFGAPSAFLFVSSRDFCAPRLRSVIIAPERSRTFVNQTTVVNNIVVQNNVVINRGPDVRMIERASGRPVRRQAIEQVARVAPFQHVSRAELAVSSERGRFSPRVATPVPESRPLPVSGQYNRPGHQGRENVPGENVTQYRAPQPHPRNTQAPSRETNPDSAGARNNRPAVEHPQARPHEAPSQPSPEAQKQHRPEPSVQAQPKAQPQPPKAQPRPEASPKKSQPEKKQNPKGGGSDSSERHDH